MATQTEIGDCFNALHAMVNAAHERKHGRLTGQAKFDADETKKVIDIGIFIGQSVVEDIKQIAVALTVIAECAEFEARLKGKP